MENKIIPSASAMREKAISRWDNEGGAGITGPQNISLKRLLLSLFCKLRKPWNKNKSV